MYNKGLTNEMKLTILTMLLNDIQQGTVYLKGWGLCANLTEMLNYKYPKLCCASGCMLVRELGADWPLHTGSVNYPVPAPKESRLDNMDAYAFTNDKYTGTYGELRVSLLNFMIGRITERINNINAINKGV